MTWVAGLGTVLGYRADYASPCMTTAVSSVAANADVGTFDCFTAIAIDEMVLEYPASNRFETSFAVT